MQIIQNIRDKGAAIVIGVIALSLIGFIMMDAKQGGGSMFGSNSTSVGKINGQSVERQEFSDKVKQVEEQYGGRVTGTQVYQVRQNVWDQIVAEKVLTGEFEKLGIGYTGKEVVTTILSDDAPQSLKQAFSDKTTGQYDIAKAATWWKNEAKKSKGDQRDAIMTQVIDPMVLQGKYSKYNGMISASAYYPTWMQEKENAEKNTFANISYVSIPYNKVSDSTVTVSDEDIVNYMGKHKELYKQEAGRYLSYVTFSSTATTADTMKAYENVSSLKPTFMADTNAKNFVARNMSVVNYNDVYVPKSKLETQQKDTVVALSVGTVFGPYLDGKNIVLAKMVGVKTLPDSIKCRHILIATTNRETGEQILDSAVAHRRIDSIAGAIAAGASFDQLEGQFSTDQAAHKDKGVMTFDIATIQNKESFAPEFGEFLLNEKGETRKTVKTNFGWHYIELLEKKNPSPAYKVAYMAKEIIASDETVNAASSKASKLSAEARNEKALKEYTKKNGLQINDVPSMIKENDYSVGGLTDARQVVKWAFEAKQGEVSEPFSIGEQYAVAVVTGVEKEGLPTAKSIRPLIEATVRNAKKAEIISKKLGTSPTLESAAAAYQVQVATAGADSTITFGAQFINSLGQEPKVIGASFNKAYQTKASEPIEGVNGVYVVKVNSLGNKPADTPENIAMQNDQRAKSIMQQMGGWFQSLKKLADIKDNRSTMY